MWHLSIFVHRFNIWIILNFNIQVDIVQLTENELSFNKSICLHEWNCYEKATMGFSPCGFWHCFKKTRKQMLKPLHFQCLSFRLTPLHSWVPLFLFLVHIWFTNVRLLQGARSWWCSTKAMVNKSRSPSLTASSSYWLLRSKSPR